MTTNQKHIPLIDISEFAETLLGSNAFAFNFKKQKNPPFFATKLSEIAPEGLLGTPYLYDFYTVYFVTKGAIEKINQLRTLRIGPKQVFFSKPGEIKTWQRLKNVEGFMVAFTMDYLLLLVDDKNFVNNFEYLLPKAHRKFELNEAQSKIFKTIFKEVLKEFKNPKKQSHEMIKLWVFVLFIKTNRIYAEQNDIQIFNGFKNAAEQLYARFLIKFEDSFKKLAQGEIPRPPKVSEFANMLNVNPTYLGECIRKVSGKSTKLIINKRILLLAKCQLLHTHNNISEIGYQLGFESSAYFIRFFKKFEGITPLEFRKEHAKQYSLN